MDNLYIEGPLKTFEDDYRRMRSSNDLIVDNVVDLSSLGVVDLDTSIVPDVFGLRAFDAQEPVAWALLGDFGNSVETMHKRQADMEYLRHACRRQYDSEFGGGRAGTCPHCGVYVISNLA